MKIEEGDLPFQYELELQVKEKRRQDFMTTTIVDPNMDSFTKVLDWKERIRGFENLPPDTDVSCEYEEVNKLSAQQLRAKIDFIDRKYDDGFIDGRTKRKPMVIEAADNDMTLPGNHKKLKRCEETLVSGSVKYRLQFNSKSDTDSNMN